MGDKTAIDEGADKGGLKGRLLMARMLRRHRFWRIS